MAGEAACSLELPDQPLDCDICGGAPLVAAGLVTGQVLVYRYQQATDSSEDSQASTSYSAEPAFTRPSKKKGPKGSCRAVAFSAGDGASLLCGFEDGAILQLDSATGKLQRKLGEAHSAAISRLLPVGAAGAHIAAAGDEDGHLQLWDLRAKQAIYSYTKHKEFIADMTMQEEEGCLVAVSGDGTLSVHDLRQGGAGGAKCRARSETDADDEMLSVVALKRGKKLAIGTQSGVLSLYSWGYFNDCSDRFPGHPESVDAIVKFDEDTIITGSSDGMLRILNIFPNKLLSVAGQHDQMPVEALAISGDRRVLASASHDNTVKLWDLAYLHDEDGETDADEGEDAAADDTAADADIATAAAAAAAGVAPAVTVVAETPGESDGDSDDSSDDSDSGRARKRRRTKGKREKTRMTKSNNKKKAGGANFFAGLL